jgi:hypothetical protein
MGSLINKLFDESQTNAIQKLWDDKDSRFLVQKEIGKKLLDNKEIIDELPLTQVMFIVSLSNFADSETECYSVAEIIYWGLHRIDIMPRITEHNGKDLAYRCLISLGFFKKGLIKRWERHAAPSPSFYRQVGIQSFENIGMRDIGNHFYQWENFMGEFFI